MINGLREKLDLVSHNFFQTKFLLNTVPLAQTIMLLFLLILPCLISCYFTNNFRQEDYVSNIIMAEDLKAKSTHSKILVSKRKKEKIIIKRNKKGQSALPLLPQRENAECVQYDSRESYMESCLSNLFKNYIYLFSLIFFFTSEFFFFFFIPQQSCSNLYILHSLIDFLLQNILLGDIRAIVWCIKM